MPAAEGAAADPVLAAAALDITQLSDGELDRLLARRSTPQEARRKRPARGVIVSLSGRNQLRGFVEEVRIDGLMAQIRLRVGDQSLTAVITKDAVGELRLRRGDEALAIIKSTEVMAMH